MKPRIDGTKFGSITIDGSDIERDVFIRLSGEIKKRKKKLSKAVFGTSHIISLDEAKHIFEKGAERLIIGSGHNGNVTLSEEAADYFKKKAVQVDLFPTPAAIHQWNKAKGAIIGLFHVTC
ncbi:MTH938/NDUFAF3 family protein [Nitrosomonas sp. Is37]|uniref:MTH938/NDUFAF3 family protein n=1 Tax=Nitrosomonas sp. Is37 TaxID=3080535 RepID=UPI00294B443B|nr:MTH938/NDUFAF3 family protein [Nitrosomonas sp. Is37]MDV6345701.1 MTH938/NDUFAF3 family protein [Nitrosomonas sp. Is37]